MSINLPWVTVLENVKCWSAALEAKFCLDQTRFSDVKPFNQSATALHVVTLWRYLLCRDYFWGSYLELTYQLCKTSPLINLDHRRHGLPATVFYKMSIGNIAILVAPYCKLNDCTHVSCLPYYEYRDVLILPLDQCQRNHQQPTANLKKKEKAYSNVCYRTNEPSNLYN